MDGQEIYFHRHSVIHDNSDRLEVGTGVKYEASEGERGLQYTTVQIVGKLGVRTGKAEETIIESPLVGE